MQNLFLVFILLKTVFFPLQNEFEFGNLDQNAISPVKFASKRNNSKCCPKNRKIVQYFFFFFNKPILQLEYMNSKMFLPLYSIKRMGNIYHRSVTQCYTFSFLVLVLGLQSFLINSWYLDLSIVF